MGLETIGCGEMVFKSINVTFSLTSLELLNELKKTILQKYFDFGWYINDTRFSYSFKIRCVQYLQNSVVERRSSDDKD